MRRCGGRHLQRADSVRYEAVNALLLNEFLKEHRKVEEQQSTITELNSAIAEQKAANAQQQKQIEALTATVRKVSDRLQLNNSEPQLRLTTIKAHEIVHRRYMVFRPHLMAEHFGRMRFSNRPVHARGSSNERQQ